MQTYLTLTSIANGDHADGELALYNLTEHDIRTAHPHTSFPSPLRPEDVADMGYLPIQPSTVPAHSTWTHRAVLDVPVHDASANDGAGAWVQVWRIEELPAADVAASFEARQKQLKQSIDAEADSLITQVVGARATEYERAEREALAFIASGYSGAAPDMVQSDADAYGRSARQSADLIIAQAQAWRASQSQLRTARLAAKAQVGSAQVHADLDAAHQAWQVAMSGLRSQLL